jgi:flavodoxin
MNILIVYDSYFGNTEKVAQAIDAALNPYGGVKTLPVGQVTAEQVGGFDLLIIGSPTRGFRPTEAISKFLTALSKDHLAGLRVAAFDTRILLETIDSSVLRFIVDKGGYAASTIAKVLEKKGGKLLVPPEGFLVTGEQGPLKDGELERAAEWAIQIIANLHHS